MSANTPHKSVRMVLADYDSGSISRACESDHCYPAISRYWDTANGQEDLEIAALCEADGFSFTDAYLFALTREIADQVRS